MKLADNKMSEKEIIDKMRTDDFLYIVSYTLDEEKKLANQLKKQ